MEGDTPMRLEFDPTGHLVLRGREGWREPICPVCHDPIRWVLDMGSFTTYENGGYTYAHARCLWTLAGFESEANKVRSRSQPLIRKRANA